MTALLTPSTRTEPDAARRRPLLVVATAGGAVAAFTTLAGCLVLGMVGWFLSDGGSHGAPRDGLRAGALGWLLGHGSAIMVEGVRITAAPLLVTLVCAFAVWRCALRVGDLVSGHGPDADRIADGERDWTVPAATLSFGLGYAAVAVITLALAGTADTAPSLPRTLLWTAGFLLLLALPAIAVGSGRAAVWTAPLPSVVVSASATALRTLGWFLLASALLVLGSLVADFGTAMNLTSQLGADRSAAVVYVALSVLVLPNAVIFGGSYLLGPGFAVGAQTLVSPGAVVLGPLPLFPLLAALPDSGATPAWSPYLIVVPPVIAALATVRTRRLHVTTSWHEGAAAGCAGGVAAGIATGLLAALAGGAVGPARMQQVAPYAGDVLVHAVTAFGLGGLVAGLAMTWWQRRRAGDAE